MSIIESTLLDVGLGSVEIRIYTYLLSQGMATVSDICKGTKTPRTTVMENIKRLTARNLINVVMGPSGKEYRADHPSALNYLLSYKKQELDSKLLEISKTEKDLNKVIGSLSSVMTTQSIPTIRLLKGKRKVWEMYMESMLSDNVYSFCDLDLFYQVFPNKEKFFLNAIIKNSSRRVYDIVIDTHLSREIHSDIDRYHRKYLPRTSFFLGFMFGDYMIFNDIVALVQLDNNSPTAIVIESEDVAFGFKGLHKTMWELL